MPWANVPWPTTPEGPIVEADVGERGITIAQFSSLARFVRRLCRTGILRYGDRVPPGREREIRPNQRMRWTRLTMHDVCDLVIKPIIEHHLRHDDARCSWSGFINRGRARPPDLFISHSWSQPFREFVSTAAFLAKERGLTAGDVFWICTFANNQFQRNLGEDLAHSPFFAALRNERCRTMALFLDRSATSLARSWCNFEMAVVTDTERNRARWRRRRATAGAEPEPPELVAEPSSSNPSGKAIALCTAAGLVGSRRVTSGPVIDALKQLDCRAASASEPADRRSILNYVVHAYLEETPAPPEAAAPTSLLLGGLRRVDGRLELDPAAVTYEAELIAAHAAKLDCFNATMRAECESAMRLRTLVSGSACAGDAPRGAPSAAAAAAAVGGASAAQPFRIAFEHSGLRLHELRELEARLRGALGRGGVAYAGRALCWDAEEEAEGCECAKGCHLWPDGGAERGLMEGLLGVARGVTYAEHLARQQPAGARRERGVPLEYYVVCPWRVRLHEVFSAIEWHAEAHDAPDRATYFIHALSIGDRARPGDDKVACVERALSGEGKGVLLVLDRAESQKWVDVNVSLWSMFELWCAEKRRLPLTLACGGGALATTRPFPGGLWEVGEFAVDVAWNMANTRVRMDNLKAASDDDARALREAIAGGARAAGARAGDADGRHAAFAHTLNTLLPLRALPSVLRGAAFLDDGSASAKRLSEAIQLLEDLRRRVHVNLGTLRGPYGETPLHVIASRKRLNEQAKPGMADARREMQRLIRIGFDINAQDDEGETPLHWAVFAGAEWCACLLLREGANPEVRSFSGETVLDLVRSAPTAFLGRRPSEHLRGVVEAAAAVSGSVRDEDGGGGASS